MIEPLTRSLFACPRCGAAFAPERACAACGASVRRRGAVLDFLADAERERAAREVEAFYERRPFPGYAPGDDAQTLLDRSRRSPFLQALDRALSPRAVVLDCGCGTAQLAAFLALAATQRTLIAADGCPASLAAAERFQQRVGIENLQLVRGDLFQLPLARAAFDVVVCRGVVHHTPDPLAALGEVAARVAPGGVLVLGFYESYARAFHRARRALGRALGRPLRWLDPVLRRADLDPEKKEVWIADQYHHPLEHSLAFPAVLAALERQGFEWLRSVPPAAGEGGLFEPTPRPGALALWLRRVGWCLAGVHDEDAGLVALVVRRQLRA